MRSVLLAFFLFPFFLTAMVEFPEVQMLYGRMGYDYLFSGENFVSDGTRVDTKVSQESVSLRDSRFWFLLDYGIATDWAVGLKAGYVYGAAVSDRDGVALAAGGGISDIFLFLKYRVLDSEPILIPELEIKTPTGRANAETIGDLVTGDGSLDVTLRVNTGYERGRVRIGVAPAFAYRTAGYSAQMYLTADAGLYLTRGYVKVFASGKYSFLQTPLRDTEIDTHNATGSGGSFTRLAGSPSLLSAGTEVGIRVYGPYEARLFAQHSLIGSLAPNALELGISFFAPFDFYQEEEKRKIKEVPFNP